MTSKLSKYFEIQFQKNTINYFFKSILNTCGPKTFLNMGSMFFDFNSQEKVIDMMTDLLQKDQLDENRKNLELAEKMCVHLQVNEALL